MPLAQGAPAFTPDEAVKAAQGLPGPVWVVKAQIHAGGRGKGKFKEAAAGDKGGVRIAKSIDEVKTAAEQMLGKTLVTIQTGPAGRVVKRLFVEDGTAIARELYLSALVDRATSRISFIASTEGGMDIEKVAHDTPEKIVTLSIDPASGYRALPRPQDRRGPEADGRPDRPVRQADRRALPRLRRQGHERCSRSTRWW